MISLPLQVFDFVRSPEPNMVARGFGTAAVLLLLVLTLFALARVFGGRGPGQHSVRQQRALVERSGRDAMRITISAARRERASELANASAVDASASESSAPESSAPVSSAPESSTPSPKETLS